MSRRVITLRDRVISTAQAQGPAGEAWLADLPDIVEALARQWDLTLGEVYSGGTAACVVEALTPDGRAAALKVPVPGLDPTHREARALKAAGGRGYVELFAFDPDTGAMLLERLGPSLADFDRPLDDKLQIICAALGQAWTAPPPGEPFMTAPQKAAELIAIIEANWEPLGRPCAERTVERAIARARARAAAYDPATAVLAHGDAHVWNTLATDARGVAFKLVDADGVVAEPAYDLAISLREYDADLLAGDPLERGLVRCRRLAQLTGVPSGPIWQWALPERLANGLDILRQGYEVGRPSMVFADAWAAADVD